MLMGRLPGSLPVVTSVSGYTGAQRFAGMPLQPYPLPQPVPRVPIALPPVPSAPTLPAAIEAWRAQLLAMNPFYLSQKFGMPAGQVKQLLADPQATLVLYQQMQRQNSQQPGINRAGGGSGYGSVDTPESRQRLGDRLRAGFSDNPLGVVDAIRNAIGLATDPVGTLVGTAADAALGLDQGTFGLHGVRGHRRYSDEVIRAARAGTIDSIAEANRMQDAIDGTRAKAMSDRATKAHAGGRGGNASGSNRSSSGAGPGGRGPKGGGAYGGMGGVGSHGV